MRDKTPKIPYFNNNINISGVAGSASLCDVINSIREPKNIADIKAVIDATINNDTDKKKKAKESLYSYMFACNVEGGRGYENIKSFNGLAVLDFDKLPDTETAEFLRDYLFDKYKFIHAAWLSPSYRGVKALARIPIATNIYEYKKSYWSLQHDVFSDFVGFDKATQNAVLVCFQSWDKDIKVRDFNSTDIYLGKYDIDSFQYKNVKPFKVEYKKDDFHRNRCLKSIETMITRIVDNGHPQVKSASLVAGGYIGAGYLEEWEATKYVLSLIAQNEYLKKGTKGYQKTAEQFIKYGIIKPLVYEK